MEQEKEPAHQMDQEEADELLGLLSGPQESSGEMSGQARPGDGDILLEDVLRDDGEERSLLEIVSDAGLITELLI